MSGTGLLDHQALQAPSKNGNEGHLDEGPAIPLVWLRLLPDRDGHIGRPPPRVPILRRLRADRVDNREPGIRPDRRRRREPRQDTDGGATPHPGAAALPALRYPIVGAA
jgi:hypothetical protein